MLSCTNAQVAETKEIDNKIEKSIEKCIIENSIVAYYDGTFFEAVERIDSYLISHHFVDKNSKVHYKKLISGLINEGGHVLNDSFFEINAATLDYLTNPVFFSTLYNCFWLSSVQLQVDSLDFVSTLPGQVAVIFDYIVDEGSYNWNYIEKFSDLIPPTKFDEILYKSFIIHLIAVYSTRLNMYRD